MIKNVENNISCILAGSVIIKKRSKLDNRWIGEIVKPLPRIRGKVIIIRREIPPPGKVKIYSDGCSKDNPGHSF